MEEIPPKLHLNGIDSKEPSKDAPVNNLKKTEQRFQLLLTKEFVEFESNKLIAYLNSHQHIREQGAEFRVSITHHL